MALMRGALVLFCCVAVLGTFRSVAAVGGRSTGPGAVLLGTWKADVEHSIFKGRLPYKSGFMRVTARGRTITVSRDVVTASGARFHIQYSDDLDGKAVPVIGDPYFDSESTVFSGQRLAIRTEFRAGRVTGHERITVAKDGLSLVASASRTTPEDGHLYVSMILWRRQSR